MSALRKVRDKPLLSEPPVNREWWMVSEADKALIGWHFDYTPATHPSWVEALYHVRELGIPYRATREKIMQVKEALEEMREGKRGFYVAICHLYMKKSGIRVEVTQEDLDLIKKNMDKDRGYGECLARSHYCMRELGHSLEMTPDDVSRILGAAGYVGEPQRGGWIVSEYHYMLRELGLPHEMTEAEKKHMREELEKFRKEGKWWELMHMLFHLKHLMPGRENGGKAAMPPLREFEK